MAETGKIEVPLSVKVSEAQVRQEAAKLGSAARDAMQRAWGSPHSGTSFGGGGAQGIASDPMAFMAQAAAGARRRVGAVMPPDWFLAQGAKRAAAMGGLIPPVIPPSTPGGGGYFGWLKGIGQSVQNSPVGLALAQITTGLAAFRVVVGLATYAVRMLLEPLRMFWRFMQNTANMASRYYAGALRSGGGLGFSVGRANMASVLGVGEHEVFGFGEQVKMLGPKLAHSSEEMARAIPQLTSLSWEFKAMDLEVKALAMSLAAEAAPALRVFVGILREMTAVLPKVSKELFDSWIRSNPVRLIMWKMFAQFFPGGQIGAAPEPQAWSHRMPASSWERMGLVLGMGASSPAERTANNTAKLVALFGQMKGALMNDGRGSGYTYQMQ